MAENRVKTERDLISLLLQDIKLVEQWLDSGIEIEKFDSIHHPILRGIKFAAINNVTLTKKGFLYYLRQTNASPQDIQVQETLFYKLSFPTSDITEEDFPFLLQQLKDDFLKEEVLKQISSWKEDFNKKGIREATASLYRALSPAVEEAEGDRYAITYKDINEYADEFNEIIKEKIEGKEVETISSGIKEVDETISGGFRVGTLTLFTANVGNFKTTIMMNIAKHAFLEEKKNVLFVSLEMPYELMYSKMLALEAGIPLKRILKPKLLTDGELEKKNEAQERWKNQNEGRFILMDTPKRITVTNIQRQIEKYIDVFQPDIVFVDYIGNLLPEDKRERSDLQIGNMLKDLRTMARPKGLTKKGFCVVSAAQIGREALKRVRQNNFKNVSFGGEDIRGSQEYAADSDAIFAQMKDPKQQDSRLIFWCLKSRYGPTTFSGSDKVELEIKPDIGLIRSVNQEDLLNSEVQANISDMIDSYDITDDDLDDLEDMEEDQNNHQENSTNDEPEGIEDIINGVNGTQPQSSPTNDINLSDDDLAF